MAAAPVNLRTKARGPKVCSSAPERIRTSTIHKDHKALNLVTHGPELTYLSICRDVSAADHSDGSKSRGVCYHGCYQAKQFDLAFGIPLPPVDVRSPCLDLSR